MNRPAPAISIVVPTRGRPESLARCLAALERQTLGEPFEVVVVDDASDDVVAVDAAVGDLERVRLVRLPERRGPGAARNAGARVARGDVVLFTDDDCEPSPGWAEALVVRLRAGASIVAGTTTNGRTRNRWAAASHLLTDYFTARSPVAFAASNNLACAAAVLAALPFDEGFSDAAGEDRDWCERAAARGLAIEVVEAARVEHHHDLSPASFWRQQLRYGRGAYRYHRRAGETRPLETPAFYAGLLRHGLAEGVAVGALVAVSQVAIVAGWVLEAVGARHRGAGVRSR